jgi:DNA polymerase-3 subunit epsilon
MGEQPDLWQQNDLLGLMASPPAGVEDLEQEPDPHQPTPAPVIAAAVVAAPVAAPATAPVAASVAAPKLELPALAPRHQSPAKALPQVLLIIDTETTGLDPSHGQCIEVGAVLFHVASRALLAQVSFLLPASRNPAQHVNGIAAEVTQLPQPWQAGLSCFEAMLDQADAVLAHNVAFDRQWFGIGPLPAIEKPWICSMADIQWPADRHLRPTPSVRDLALAYGVPVWAAHRALTDCIYLVQVFERCVDLEELLAAAQEPRQLFRAKLSYAERHRAKEAGFRWNDPVAGAWSRRLSDREALALPFPVQPVEAA